MKQLKLGSGQRFEKLKEHLAKQGLKNPAGAAAAIGRKKYGNKKMVKLAQHGKKVEHK